MLATRCTLVCPNQVTGEKWSTHAPPHHAPKFRTYSACTAVMPTRFSVSARCAFNCANCACRWVYCLLRLIVEAEIEVEEGWEREEVEGRWEDDADILESYKVSRIQLVGDDDSWLTLMSVVVACWTASRSHVCRG